MKPELQILVGPIASGKSTHARQEAARGALIINADALVTALSGGTYVWRPEFKPIYKRMDHDLLQSALSIGLPVVIDRTNGQRRTRIRYISLAQSLGAYVRVVVFPRLIPEVHAYRRVDSDGRGFNYQYWLTVAKKHEAQYEAPDLSEGMDEMEDISLRSGWQYQGAECAH